MYDKQGNIIPTTGADGKPVDLNSIKDQVAGGVTRNWNAEINDWDTQKLTAE
jgi:hypothetical protein